MSQENNRHETDFGFKRIAEEDKAEKILENQSIIKLPVVRNGKQATIGYQPEIWKGWK